MNGRLSVSSSPHIRDNVTTKHIMLDGIIALLPAVVAGIILFGLRALLVLSVSVISAVGSEYLFNLITKKDQTVGDLSAIVTGLLLGLNLHANSPLWQCAVGSVFAIVVVKCLFGGIGCNFANPAATARVFLIVCFANTLDGGVVPNFLPSAELTTGATPLESLKYGKALPSLLDMFFGLRSGAIGEVCTLALLVGFVYLVLRKVIHFEIPLVFIGTVFALSLIYGNSLEFALANILSGGLVLGAVYMATDYATSPITRPGKMIYAFGCGLITFLIRYYGSYPEGVSFAILFMNILSPYIEGWTKNYALGGVRA